MGTLRLLLALSVVIDHGLTDFFGMPLIDATGSVWVFFTISGFLITIALTKKYSDTSLGLKSFYINRLIRIYPIYWAWLLITFIAYLLITPTAITLQIWTPTIFWSQNVSDLSFTSAAAAFFANVTGIFHDSFLRLGIDQAGDSFVYRDYSEPTPWAMKFMFIGQFWSVGVELMFYAIAPWITTKLWRVALVFFASSTGMLEGWWISATTFAHLPNEIVYIQTPKFIWMFMLGAALAHLYQSNKQKDNTNMAAYCMLVLAMYITLAIRGTALFPLQSFPWWAFVGLTVIIPALFEKTAKNKYDKFLGELSYPIYVCHFLLIQTIGSMMPPNGAVFALASCVTAVALVLLVDRPANKLKISRAKAIATDPGSGSPMTARQAM